MKEIKLLKKYQFCSTSEFNARKLSNNRKRAREKVYETRAKGHTFFLEIAG